MNWDEFRITSLLFAPPNEIYVFVSNELTFICLDHTWKFFKERQYVPCLYIFRARGISYILINGEEERVAKKH